MSSDTPRARKNAARQYQAAHPGTPYPVALRAVTPQRGATIIDREYVDYRDIAPIYGLDLDTDHPTGGFQFESDWYFNLAGRGLNPGVGPGTGTGRWLVTYFPGQGITVGAGVASACARPLGGATRVDALHQVLVEPIAHTKIPSAMASMRANTR